MCFRFAFPALLYPDTWPSSLVGGVDYDDVLHPIPISRQLNSSSTLQESTLTGEREAERVNEEEEKRLRVVWQQARCRVAVRS